MSTTFIHTLVSNGERANLECKRAQRNIPNSIWETYSAFANTYGGTILLGVEENLQETDLAKRFSVVGVEDAHKICADFWNIINSKEKVNCNILQDSDVQIIDVADKQIIKISVPQASYSIRPIYINNNLTRGTFKRSHEGDYHCSEQEIKLMLRDSNEGGNDRAILEHYTMDDIDIPSLERYRMLFNINNPEHVWKDLSHQEFLKQLGGYAQDRTTGIEGLTIAGLLMFGKGLPIRDRFDNLRMDYIDKTNLIGEQRYSDRLTYDGTWENNLLNFIRIVLPRLTRDLPRPFAMEGMERKDDTPQHKAVREAVTNAIIHADFMLNGILRIEKYDDRFVLTNPGLLKLPLEQIYAGGESKARNQRIQSMLRMIGYGENLGSGFPMILNAWNEKHWIKPTLTEQPELLQVKLTLFVQTDDIPQEPTGETRVETMGKSSEKSSEKIMDIIKQSPKITAKEISIVLGISSRGVEKQIKNLREQGILRRIGPDKGGHWEVVE